MSGLTIAAWTVCRSTLSVVDWPFRLTSERSVGGSPVGIFTFHTSQRALATNDAECDCDDAGLIDRRTLLDATNRCLVL